MRIPSRRILVVALVALSLCSVGCYRMGRFLAPEDSLTQADAIFVFAGSRAARQHDDRRIARVVQIDRLERTRGA